jgi:hypothetical protein
MAGGFKKEKTNSGQDSGAGRVQNAFEGVNAERVGEGHFVFTGNEQGTNWLSGAPKEEQGAEAGEVHGIDIPEARRADVGLKSLPAEGANGIASIDSSHSEEEIEVVGTADGVPKLSAAELTEVKSASGAIKKKRHYERT